MIFSRHRLSLPSRPALLLCVSLCWGCAPTPDVPPAPATPVALAGGYHLDTPTASYVLPKALREVSGLTALEDGTLVAIQDEKAFLYFLTPPEYAVARRHDFGSDGDYEGVARVGDHFYVLRSDGVLYRIKDWDEDKDKAQKIETSLSSRYDTEGLAYDAANHRLLILCKEYPGKDLKGHRSIYAFDLEAERLVKDPVITLHLASIYKRLQDQSPPPSTFDKLTAPLSGTAAFKPAALAIHPGTGHLFVVSSVNKALVVLDAEGHLLEAFPLEASLFRQPEGMAFLPNGDLFIANEGQVGDARLLRFNASP